MLPKTGMFFPVAIFAYLFFVNSGKHTHGPNGTFLLFMNFPLGCIQNSLYAGVFISGLQQNCRETHRIRYVVQFRKLCNLHLINLLTTNFVNSYSKLKL